MARGGVGRRRAAELDARAARQRDVAQEQVDLRVAHEAPRLPAGRGGHDVGDLRETVDEERAQPHVVLEPEHRPPVGPPRGRRGPVDDRPLRDRRRAGHADRHRGRDRHDPVGAARLDHPRHEAFEPHRRRLDGDGGLGDLLRQGLVRPDPRQGPLINVSGVRTACAARASNASRPSSASRGAACAATEAAVFSATAPSSAAARARSRRVRRKVNPCRAIAAKAA